MSIPAIGPIGPSDPEEVWNPNAEMALAETAPARPMIELDARAIAERIYNGLADRAPGWVAADAGLETWLIDEFSTIAAEIRYEAVVDVPESIYRVYGEEVLGIPAQPETPATGASTWRAVDQRGYGIPAGTQITLPRPGAGDELVVFEVTAAARIPDGETQIQGVPIVAQAAGAAGNGIAGVADVVDPLFWVDSIEVPEPTDFGSDGQTVERYLSDTLIPLLRVIALRPILPWDFAVLALRIPGVGRAVAMDGWEPSSGTWWNPRRISLILTDLEGDPVPSAVKQAVRAYLEGLREVNWRVYTLDADYQAVDVNAEVWAFAEQDPAVVEELCVNAIREELRPANYRLGTTSPAIAAGEVIPPPPDGSGVDWRPGRQSVRVSNVIGLLDRTRGVDWVDDATVTLNGAHQDLVLPGPTSLPRPGQITVTVTVQ